MFFLSHGAQSLAESHLVEGLGACLVGIPLFKGRGVCDAPISAPTKFAGYMLWEQYPCLCILELLTLSMKASAGLYFSGSKKSLLFLFLGGIVCPWAC